VEWPSTIWSPGSKLVCGGANSIACTRPAAPHLVAPLHALRVRREQTPDGWCLHLTVRDATGELMDTVFDYIEHWLSPA
jgi:hypothetical protein